VAIKYVWLFFLPWLVFLTGCGGGIQAAGDVARGREALFRGNNQAALGYFQTAAQTDPNYVFSTDRPEGVDSYLGRAQYLNGQYAEARQSLENDLSQHPEDNLSRLYLGLILVRLNDRQSGLRDIEAGLKGIRDFLNDVTTNAPDLRRRWDPYRDICNAIARALGMIESPNLDWESLLVLSERIAVAWEQEPDMARDVGMGTRGYNLNP